MRKVVFVVLYALGLSAHALPESTINVLGVLLSDGAHSANAARAQQFMTNLTANWPDPAGVTVTLMYGGELQSLSSSAYGYHAQILSEAQAAAEAAGIRGAADVIIFFAEALDFACGLSDPDVRYWINQNGNTAFVGDPNYYNLDLRDKDVAYSAVVSTTPACLSGRPEVALHELGHMFGAGHDIDDPVEDVYLFPDSRSLWYTDYYWYEFQTVMSNHGFDTSFLFSAAAGSYNNLGTLQTTAQSVANYRNGLAPGNPSEPSQCDDGVDNDSNTSSDYPNDPGCSSPADETETSIPEPPNCGLTAPVAVSGMLTGVCAPPPYTDHYVWWADVCPSASTHYEVWYNQNYSGYVYGWSEQGPQTFLKVWGAHADIKIKACNGGVCSGLSAGSYFAYQQC